jgi:hypothetical protein
MVVRFCDGQAELEAAHAVVQTMRRRAIVFDMDGRWSTGAMLIYLPASSSLGAKISVQPSADTRVPKAFW